MLGDREKCIQAQMDEYLSKPLKQNILIQVILKVSSKVSYPYFPFPAFLHPRSRLTCQKSAPSLGAGNLLERGSKLLSTLETDDRTAHLYGAAAGVAAHRAIMNGPGGGATGNIGNGGTRSQNTVEDDRLERVRGDTSSSASSSASAAAAAAISNASAARTPGLV